MVDQPEYGTNTSYLVDFIKITLSAKLLKVHEIHDLYIKQGQSAAQIACHFGVAKSVILKRLHGIGVRVGLSSGRMTNPENYRCRTPPYGYSIKAGKLIPSKAELRICRMLVELVGRQKKSATWTARELGRRGYKNRAGRTTWDHSTVQSIFKRWKDKL